MDKFLRNIENSEKNNPQLVAALQEIERLQAKLSTVLFLTGYSDDEDSNAHLTDEDRLQIIMQEIW